MSAHAQRQRAILRKARWDCMVKLPKNMYISLCTDIEAVKHFFGRALDFFCVFCRAQLG